MPKINKKKAVEQFKAKYLLRPFTIHYIYLGEKDTMDVWEYSPKRARKKLTDKYPEYKILTTVEGHFEKPEKKVPSNIESKLNLEIFNFNELINNI